MIRWPWVRRVKLDAALEALDDLRAEHLRHERLILAGLHAAQVVPADREAERLRDAVRVAARVVETFAPQVVRSAPLQGSEWARAALRPDESLPPPVPVWEWLKAEAEHHEPRPWAAPLNPAPPSTSPED